jgi:RNA polymerase sigma-70 factor (ECF subfamily)
LTDDKLIQQYHEGDEGAFKELIKRYESRVAATVFGMLGNCPEAYDVGQETFIRFHQSLDKFRGDASVGTYLTRIAINLSLNELKRRKRRDSLFKQSDSENSELEIPDSEATSEYNGEQELVRNAIQKLEPKFRAVVVLRLMDGYSTKETAKILKLPVGTVLSRLARAQKKLKEILSPYMGDRG